MTLHVVRFLAMMFAALALVPAGAHVAELPNKIVLSAAEYLIVQQIYRGWAVFAVVVFGALISTLWLTILVRGSGHTFNMTLIAFLCIAGTQVVFWTFTFPVNEATKNWTTMPPNWMELRDRWEYSHAASAALNLIAVAALILSSSNGSKSERT